MIIKYNDRLFIIDLMMLVVATSLGLWAARNYWAFDQMHTLSDIQLLSYIDVHLSMTLLLKRVGTAAGIVLLAWTAGLLVLRLGRQTVQLRWELQLTGTIVCINGVLATSILFIVYILKNESAYIGLSRLSLPEKLWPFFDNVPMINGIAALCTALTAYLKGGWRSQRGWHCCAGVMLCILWFLSFIYSHIIVPIICIRLR